MDDRHFGYKQNFPKTTLFASHINKQSFGTLLVMFIVAGRLTLLVT
jgi:hypothetical protein